MKRVRLVCLVLLVPLLLVIVWALVRSLPGLNDHLALARRVDQLAIGMSEQDVRSLIGAPYYDCSFNPPCVVQLNTPLPNATIVQAMRFQEHPDIIGIAECEIFFDGTGSLVGYSFVGSTVDYPDHPWPQTKMATATAQDTEVLTQASVLAGTQDVLLVSFDPISGMWTYLPGRDRAQQPMATTTLKRMFELDASVLDVWNLHEKAEAYRSSPNQEWITTCREHNQPQSPTTQASRPTFSPKEGESLQDTAEFLEGYGEWLIDQEAHQFSEEDIRSIRKKLAAVEYPVELDQLIKEVPEMKFAEGRFSYEDDGEFRWMTFENWSSTHTLKWKHKSSELDAGKYLIYEVKIDSPRPAEAGSEE